MRGRGPGRPGRGALGPGRSLLLLALLTSPALAWGQGRLLHERIIDPSREASPLVEQPAEGQNPAALRTTEAELAEPHHGAEPRAGEQPFEDAPPPRDTAESHQRLRQWSPDLMTDRTAEELSYHSTFSPSIAPHKRISALDQVGADYTLSLSSSELAEVPIGGSADEDRDLFWGSVVVRFIAGRPIPIPSVAPEARILSVRPRPEVGVSFSRDRAGNFYASSPESGQVRLVFVTDAPASYFGGPLPGQVRAADVPAELRPALPPNVQRATQRVASRLGLDPAAPIARNLSRLVAYLRSFENEPLEGETSGVDRYLTLAFGRRGVCRHRAFVFVVTAQGLGIPARFVTNEVHAFSEVYVPTVGWVRIDLGGEARLAPESEPTIAHQPRAPDPFPWPQGSQEPGREGTTPRGGHGQIAGRSAPSEPRSDSEQGSAGAPEGEGRPLEIVETDNAPAEGAEEAEAPAEPPPPQPQPRQLVVYLDRYGASVVRGQALALSGAVHASGEGAVPGAQVNLWLQGVSSSQMLRLGRATCDDSGRFRAHLAVPGTIPTGDYRIVARAEETLSGD